MLRYEVLLTCTLCNLAMAGHCCGYNDSSKVNMINTTSAIQPSNHNRWKQGYILGKLKIDIRLFLDYVPDSKRVLMHSISS